MGVHLALVGGATLTAPRPYSSCAPLAKPKPTESAHGNHNESYGLEIVHVRNEIRETPVDNKGGEPPLGEKTEQQRN